MNCMPRLRADSGRTQAMTTRTSRVRSDNGPALRPVVRGLPLGSEPCTTCLRRVRSFRYTHKLHYSRIFPYIQPWVVLQQNICYEEPLARVGDQTRADRDAGASRR